MIAVFAMGALVSTLLIAIVVLMILSVRDAWRAVDVARRLRMREAAARLSSDEAIALAAVAIGEGLHADVLGATLEEHGGLLVWAVASATIDMGVTVTVDDATGAVGDVRHWSGWRDR